MIIINGATFETYNEQLITTLCLEHREIVLEFSLCIKCDFEDVPKSLKNIGPEDIFEVRLFTGDFSYEFDAFFNSMEYKNSVLIAKITPSGPIQVSEKQG